MAHKRIVLSNSYGTPNVGDEAILTVLVDELSNRGIVTDILTFTPEATAKRHPRANAVMSGVVSGAFATLAAIRGADALVVGGGGILQDATSLGNLLFHVSRPLMASLTKTPVIIAGVGVGPLRWSLSRRLTRRACQIAASIDVRDVQSAKLLADIGVPAERVECSADLAHLLRPSAPDDMDETGRALVDTLRQLRAKNRSLVGLSLRPAVGNASRRAHVSDQDASHLDAVTQIADQVIERYGAQVVFVSMHPQQDDPIGSALARRMRRRDRLSMISGKLPPATIKAAVAELDLMIGTRLHSLIFAASHAVPLVALAYDDKVEAYVESLELPTQILDADEWQADSVLSLVDRTLEMSAPIREQLQNTTPRLVAAAEESVGRICAFA